MKFEPYHGPKIHAYASLLAYLKLQLHVHFALQSIQVEPWSIFAFLSTHGLRLLSANGCMASKP